MPVQRERKAKVEVKVETNFELNLSLNLNLLIGSHAFFATQIYQVSEWDETTDRVFAPQG